MGSEQDLGSPSARLPKGNRVTMWDFHGETDLEGKEE